VAENTSVVACLFLGGLRSAVAFEVWIGDDGAGARRNSGDAKGDSRWRGELRRAIVGPGFKKEGKQGKNNKGCSDCDMAHLRTPAEVGQKRSMKVEVER
jgi:hypothetical protein